MPTSVCFCFGCKTGSKSQYKLRQQYGFKIPSLFKAPKDPDMFEKWRKAIPPSWRPLKNDDSVCARHFKPEEITEDYETKLPNGTIFRLKRGRPCLRKDAVPSIFFDVPGLKIPNPLSKRSTKFNQRKSNIINEQLSTPVSCPDKSLALQPVTMSKTSVNVNEKSKVTSYFLPSSKLSNRSAPSNTNPAFLIHVIQPTEPEQIEPEQIEPERIEPERIEPERIEPEGSQSENPSIFEETDNMINQGKRLYFEELLHPDKLYPSDSSCFLLKEREHLDKKTNSDFTQTTVERTPPYVSASFKSIPVMFKKSYTKTQHTAEHFSFQFLKENIHLVELVNSWWKVNMLDNFIWFIRWNIECLMERRILIREDLSLRG